MTIGEKVETLLYNNGMTQRELAKELGYEQQTISRWACNKNKPSFDACQKMAAIFKVPIGILVDDNEVIKKKEKAMTKDKLYTYEALGLDNGTCVCVTDALMVLKETDKPDIFQTIEQAIEGFYGTFYDKAGDHQLYIFRPLNDAPGIALCAKYWDSSCEEPDSLTFMRMNNAEKETELLKATVDALKDIIVPIKATAIIVEQEPCHWAFISV